MEPGDDSVLRVKKNGDAVWSSPNKPITPTPTPTGWSYMFHEPKMAKRISSPYGWRDLDGDEVKEEFHKGIDIVHKTPGEIQNDYPVYPVAKGTIMYAGFYGAAGNTVAIKLNDGKVVRYLHLQSELPKEAGTVNSNDLIGYVGNSGGNYAYHLHFDVNTANTYDRNLLNSNNTLNPVNFFPNVAWN